MLVHRAKSTHGALATWHRNGRVHFIILIEDDVVDIIALDG